MTIPHSQPWWGGKYRLTVDGEELAHEKLASSAEFTNFSVVKKPKMTQPVAFTANQAPKGGGGAVFWDTVEPGGMTDIDKTHFDHGNAALYGDRWATGAVVLSRATKDNATLAAISGSTVEDVSVELLDFYGQRIRSDDTSVVLAAIAADGAAMNATLVGPLAICEQGLATFTDLAIYAKPEVSVQLQLSATSLSIPSMDVDIALDVCPAGTVEQETAQKNIVCTECEKPSFEHEGVCVDCASGLDCDAAESGAPLSTLAVLAGYWRHLDTSFDLYKCAHEEACVGTGSEEARRRHDNTSELCGRGYQGILCSCCQPGFVLNLERCVDCASINYTTRVILAAVSVAVVLVLFCLLRNRHFVAAIEPISLGVEFKVKT